LIFFIIDLWTTFRWNQWSN